jgi:hypothetical protein
MQCSTSFAEERDGFRRFPPAAPAILAASTRAVRCIWVTVFRGEHEKRVCTVKVLFVLARADAIRKTICEEVLGCGMSSVGKPPEQGRGLPYEIFPLLYCLLYDEEVAWGELR